MPTPDKQLSAEQSRQIADTIREEIARRRISRQSLAELAKLSLSTLEKVLGGRRPFTLATTVRLEQALGVSLRKTPDAPAPAAPNQRRRRARWSGRLFAPRGGVDRRHLCHDAAVVWRQGRDLRLPHRDRLGRCGVFPGVSRERTAGRGLHPVRRSGGAEPVRPHLSRHQPARPASPDHGVAADHLGRDVRHHHDAARGPRLAVDADRRPDRVLPIKMVASPTFGRVSADDPNYAQYREHLRRTTEEPFAMFLPG